MGTSWGTSAGETGRSHRCEQHRCRGDHHGDGGAKFHGISSGGAKPQSRSQAQMPCHRFSPDRRTSALNPSSRPRPHDEISHIHRVSETTTTLDAGAPAFPWRSSWTRRDRAGSPHVRAFRVALGHVLASVKRWGRGSRCPIAALSPRRPAGGRSARTSKERQGIVGRIDKGIAIPCGPTSLELEARRAPRRVEVADLIPAAEREADDHGSTRDDMAGA